MKEVEDVKIMKRTLGFENRRALLHYLHVLHCLHV